MTANHDIDWYSAMADHLTERALLMMRGEFRNEKDAGAELSLAAAAWDAVMGTASLDVLADLDEYVLTKEGNYELPEPP